MRAATWARCGTLGRWLEAHMACVTSKYEMESERQDRVRANTTEQATAWAVAVWARPRRRALPKLAITLHGVALQKQNETAQEAEPVTQQTNKTTLSSLNGGFYSRALMGHVIESGRRPALEWRSQRAFCWAPVTQSSRGTVGGFILCFPGKVSFFVRSFRFTQWALIALTRLLK